MIRDRILRACLNSWRGRLWLAAAMVLLLGLSACGGGGGGSSAGISFATQQLAPPQSLGLSLKASIAAIVSQDAGSKGVDWAVTCTPGKAKGADCGVITSHTASGYPTTYTAPAGDLTANSIPVGGTVTITATSSADPSHTVSATIQIVLKPITIGFNTVPPVAMQTGAVLNIVPVLANDLYKPDGSLSGVDLTVTCVTTGSCGTIRPAHTDGVSTGSGAVYTAPAIIPTDGLVTITATSTADPSKSVFAIITITQAPLSVAFAQMPASNLPAGAATNLSAIVNFDPLNAGIDWTLTCLSENCGSLSVLHTTSNQLITYTAPPTVPLDNVVTITATSTSLPETFVSVVVSVTPADLRNDLLNGRYAFMLQGVRAGGPFALAGSLLADGIGNISAVTENLLGENNAYTLAGTYFIDSQGSGTITLNGAPTGLGYWHNRQQIFKVSVVSTGHMLLQEYDGYFDADLHIPYGGTLSGTLEQQDTTSFRVPTSGAFSFLLSGSTTGNSPAFYGGTLSGSTYTFSMDRSIAGVVDSITSNNYGTAGIIPAGDGSRGMVRIGPYAYNYVVVDAGHWFLVAQAGTDDLAAGHFYGQPTAPAAPSGPYVFTSAGATALSPGRLPLALGGTFACDSQGSLSGVQDANTNGTVTSAEVTGNCTMATSGVTRGRGTLTMNGGAAQQFAIYPTATHGALLLQLDGQNSSAGVAWPQTTGATAAPALFAGNYATAFQALGAMGGDRNGVGWSYDFLGMAAADGSSALSGSMDLEQFDESLYRFWLQTPEVVLTGDFTAGPQGRFPGSLASAPLGSAPHVFYLVDGATVLSLGEGALPSTGVLQRQQF
ncbi:MAG: hypothetical protein JST79_09350 [Acidobacteria bacterium]|nr:hypothetical protein [Acidobacteriota bacterium]